MAFFAVYDSVEQLYEEYNLLKLNGKCGIYDATKNDMIIPYKYDDITCIMCKPDANCDSGSLSREVFTGYFQVKLQNQCGVYDKLGNEILPCKYDSVNISFPFKYCIFKLGERCGIYDLTERKYVIDVGDSNFQEIKPVIVYELEEERFARLFCVKQNNKYGICNVYGKKIIPCQYDNIEVHDGNGNKRIIRLDNKSCVYNFDTNQMIVPCKYDEIYYIEIGPYGYVIDNIWVLKNEGRLGLYGNGSEILPCQYEEIEEILNYYSFEEPLPADKLFSGYFKISKDKKYGICDRNGRIIVPCAYNSISDDGSFWDVELYSKHGAYDKSGNSIIPCIYNEIKYVKAIIDKSLQKDNYDAWGNMKNYYNICDCSYQYIVKNENMYGVYDVKQKKEIILCKYIKIRPIIKIYNCRENYTINECDVKIDYYKCLIDNQWINVYV